MSDRAHRFRSEFFEIQTLADGVYAAVGPQEGLCHSNAGIVDLGEQTLVFDTLTLPSYGKDLARACRELTGRDPTWIAISHFHADHWLGNQAFEKNTPILATQGMLSPLEERMGQFEGLPGELDDFQKQIDELATACEAEENRAKRAGLETNLARYRALHAEAADLNIRQPSMAFDGTLRLIGTQRTVDLVEVRKAHTASDVYLSIPDARIVFMGDLGFFDTLPFLMYADPLGWIEALKTLEASEATVFVPGHGVVADVEHVRLCRECIESVIAVVRAARASGEDLDESLTERLAEPFRTWCEGRTWIKEQLEAISKALPEAS